MHVDLTRRHAPRTFSKVCSDLYADLVPLEKPAREIFTGDVTYRFQ